MFFNKLSSLRCLSYKLKPLALFPRTTAPVFTPNISKNLHKISQYYYAQKTETNHYKMSPAYGDLLTDDTYQYTEAPKETKDLITRENLKEYLQTASFDSNVDFTYNNKTLFEFSDPGYARKDGPYQKFRLGFWMGLSYLVFMFVHPWAVVIPGYFATGSVVGLAASRKIKNSLVTKIELVDNANIRIYPQSLKGGSIMCSIKDTNICVVGEMPAEQMLEGLLATVNFVDSANKEKHSNMVMFIDPKLSRIPNIDLLKSILNGNLEQVAKFKYEESAKRDANVKESQGESDSNRGRE